MQNRPRKVLRGSSAPGRDVVLTLCVVDAVEQRRLWWCVDLVLEQRIAQRVEHWHKLG
jgi:hypothetical protein